MSEVIGNVILKYEASASRWQMRFKKNQLFLIQQYTRFELYVAVS